MSIRNLMFIVAALTLANPFNSLAQGQSAEATLVQTIDTSVFVPPSPDPAGIVYMPGSDTFLISDSEVNEMSIFTGDNIYEMTRLGVLVNTETTLPLPPFFFSAEPTDVAFNPLTGNLFITDDNEGLVFEIGPGSDGVLFTIDDDITSIDTFLFNSFDPEGLAFDTSGIMYIIDGVGAEVFRISPGPNGIFDGTIPLGDDQVESFDTEVLGIVDPEGITFDTDNGLLYFIGRPEGTLAHVTTDGTLIRLLDVSDAGATNPSGLSYAPGSLNPSVNSIYITDRRVDNNENSNENDGRIYEFSIFPIIPGNLPPVVSAGPDQSILLAEFANLNGTASDDGLPSPPGQITTTWSVVSSSSGGEVTFSDPTALQTTASFSAAGTYVLQLTADDSSNQVSDEVTVIVSANAQSFGVTDDSYVDAQNPDSNFGSLPDLLVVNSGAGLSQSTSYLKFNLSGISGTIQSAILHLGVSNPGVNGGSIHQVLDNNWDQSSITFNNSPAFESVVLDSVGAVNQNDVVTFDVTSAISGSGTYSFAISGEVAGCVGGGGGLMGDTGTTVGYVAQATGEKVYFSPFTPTVDGEVTYIHFEEFSTAAPVRAGIYDANGVLLASSAERMGNNSNPGTEMHEALDQPVCLVAGQTYYLGVWGGDDSWVGTAYGSSGTTFYNSDITSFPPSLSLPGTQESGSRGIRATVNNSPDSFNDNSGSSGPSYFSSENTTNTPLLFVFTTVGGTAPIAVDDPNAATTAEETAVITANVLSNDTLVDNAAISAFDASSVNGGVVSNNGDGTFTYTPALDFSGPDSFTYTLTDDDGESDTATVGLTVTPVNDGAPIAVDDPNAATTTEETAVITANVLSNDTLVDNAAISTFDASSVNGGVVSNNGDGTFTYTPALDFSGPDSFTYTLTDDDGESDTATVGLTVTPVNDGAPIAVDDPNAATTAEETAVITTNVLSNDTLVDNAAISTFDASSVNGGVVSNNGDGTFTYTPALDFSGPDSFTYTLTDDDGESDTATVGLTVTPVSTGAPIAVDDPNAATTAEETAVITANVLSNDTLVDNAAISTFDASSVNGGVVSNNGDGTFTYTPALDFNGSDSFTYTLTDDDGESDAATVGLTVTPVNDGAPIAVDDPNAATTTEETAVITANVLSNDTLVDNAAISTFDASSVNGGVVSNNGDGTFTYTPPATFIGGDSFTYTLTDDDGESDAGTVGLSVEAFSCVGGIDGTMGDTGATVGYSAQAAGDTVYFSPFSPTEDGEVTYIHFEEFSTAAPVRAGIYDANGVLLASSAERIGNNSNPGTVMHEALDQPVCLAVGQTYYLAVWGGDDSWAGTAYGSPGITRYNDGLSAFPSTISIPGDNQSGSRGIRVAVNNSASSFDGSSGAGAPIAVDDPNAATTAEETAVITANVLSNDTLVDNAAISAFDASSVNGGVVSNNGDGTFTYTPALDFSGPDSFTYTLTDDDGESDTATVGLTVTPVNDGAPIAVDDPNAATTTEETAVITANVLSNDTLVDNAAISTFDASSVNGGVVSNNGDGTFTYTPALDFSGPDSFTYTLTDDDGESDTATVGLTVTPVNDGAPIAVDDPNAATTAEETAVITTNVLSNDTLVDNAAISTFDASSVNGGVVSNNGDGTFTYTPALDFSGPDSFTYTLTDDDGESDTATVGLTVTPVSTGAPIAVDDPNAATTAEETAVITANVLSNDTLVDNAAISTFDASSVNGGVVSNNGDGTFTYTPALDFNGSDSFTYTLTDDDGESDAATVGLTVTPVNDGAPIAVDDPNAATTTEETAVITANVLSNDTLVDNAAISTFDASSVNGGVVSNNGDGTFTYTPPATFIGGDSFTYTLTDDDGESDAGTVGLSVEAFSCVGGIDGTMGDTGATVGYSAQAAGDTVYFSPFSPTEDGEVTYIHFEEFSTAAPVRAGIYDANGVLLASSAERIGNNSNPGTVMHEALDQPVCLAVGQTYYLAVWGGDDSWAGTAYGSPGITRYNDGLSAFPSTISIPGSHQSGSRGIRVSVNNDPSAF